MNLLLYVILLIIISLYKTPIINCDNNNKIYECHKNNIRVLYDTSNNGKSEPPCLPMSSSCLNIKKYCKRKEIIKNSKYRGPFISKIIQSGIRETISFTKKNTDKDTYIFKENDNKFVDIPFPTKGFKFRAFAPNNFLNMRNLYNISEDFDTSLQFTSLLIGGFIEDCIDTYYYTHDYKFHITKITEENVEYIVSFLQKYFSHFCKNQLSILPKIAGLYHIKHKKYEQYFIVKPYIFPNIPRIMDILYYTKGIPETGFLINDDKFNPKSCRTEHDIMTSFREGLVIPSHTYKSLQQVLIKDTEFLKSLNISDFIFMFSVSKSDKSYNKVHSALVNQLRDVTNPDSNDTSKLNLIAYISIDNIYKKKENSDQSYYTFHHFYCKFKHQVNQNTDDYGKRLVNFITEKLFKSNGK